MTAGVQMFTWAFPGGAAVTVNVSNATSGALRVVGLHPIIARWQSGQIEFGHEMVFIDKLDRLGRR